METHGLTAYPQRGYITRHTWSGTIETESGWFTLGFDNQTICRRKVGGRNTYQYTNIQRVIAFTIDPNAKD